MTFERSRAETLGTASTTGLPRSSAYPTPAVGCPVYTADGDKLGTVKELAGSAFKVNAHLQPDYWLSFSCVRAATPERVELAFPKDRLGDYKQDNPVHG
jgi:hypothetical protein